jgi:DNA polymerase-3 subunit delta'
LLSHQPGRLPATIRSRCQHVPVALPDVATLARWLAAEPAAVEQARRWSGRAPLPLAAAVGQGDSSIFNKLESDLLEVSEDRIDPQTVAQAWAKGDTEAVLSWLKRRVHTELKARLAQGSTEVTVPATATLHNAWRALPTRALFDEYDRAEKLLNLLGSGLNVELALVAMLNALVVNRGRS